MVFKREIFSLDLFSELLPLLLSHYKEINIFPDIELDPDVTAYTAMEGAGVLRLFTFRREGVLAGYAGFMFVPHPHFRGRSQAVTDILYVLPEHRGYGVAFIRWCNEQLAAEGAFAVYCAAHVGTGLESLLPRMGYHEVETNFVKRLHKVEA